MTKACKPIRNPRGPRGAKGFEMSRSPLVGLPALQRPRPAPTRRVAGLPSGKSDRREQQDLDERGTRAKLIELIKQQRKPFGLLIDDIAGGFTFTGRGQPQAFQVCPSSCTKYSPTAGPTVGARRGHRRNAAGVTDKNCGHRRYHRSLQRVLRRGIGFRSGFGGLPRHSDYRTRSPEEREFHGPASDFALSRA